MKERIFTTKEQGRVLIEAGLPISTASGFRDKYLDQLHSMEDNAGRIGLIEAVTPDISNPVWDVGTLLNLLPYEIAVYSLIAIYFQQLIKQSLANTFHCSPQSRRFSTFDRISSK